MYRHDLSSSTRTFAAKTSRRWAAQLNFADHVLLVETIGDLLESLESALRQEGRRLQRTYQDRQGVTGDELRDIAVRAQRHVGRARQGADDAEKTSKGHLGRLRGAGHRIVPNPKNAVLLAAAAAHTDMSTAVNAIATVESTADHVAVLSDLTDATGHLSKGIKALAGLMAETARETGKSTSDKRLSRAAGRLNADIGGVAVDLVSAWRLTFGLSKFKFDNGPNAARQWPKPR